MKRYKCKKCGTIGTVEFFATRDVCKECVSRRKDINPVEFENRQWLQMEDINETNSKNKPSNRISL